MLSCNRWEEIPRTLLRRRPIQSGRLRAKPAGARKESEWTRYGVCAARLPAAASQSTDSADFCVDTNLYCLRLANWGIKWCIGDSWFGQLGLWSFSAHFWLLLPLDGPAPRTAVSMIPRLRIHARTASWTKTMPAIARLSKPPKRSRARPEYASQ